MSISTQIQAAFEIAKTADHTGVGAAYAPLGNPLSQPAQSLIITSTLGHGQGQDTSCWISTDGVNDHLFVKGKSSIVIDVSGNKQAAGKLSFPKGTQFYVKTGPDATPNTGDISLTTIYAR